MNEPMKWAAAAALAAALAAPLAAPGLPLSAQDAPAKAPTNAYWWPQRLDLAPLRQHAAESSPAGARFDYAREFATLDLAALKRDIAEVMTTSQPWWPADYGNYGPLFIRMAWHAAGTYRVDDGRGGADGGQQRMEPLNSWPDNANLDKARRVLWPIKKKYGNKISWADLLVLSGNVALESMGFQTLGFAGGRTDDWEADEVYWGPETKFLADERHTGDRELEKPLAAAQMGLIYVNPEGPGGNADPLSAASEIRRTFGRMAMNDEETVALIAGGHSFGKAHGAVAASCVGVDPAAAAIEKQGLGWENKCGAGKGGDAFTSGLEGAWTSSPTRFTMEFLNNLFGYEWVKSKSPAGATQWIPSDPKAAGLVPDAHDPSKKHAPIMLTTDLSLKMDPAYRAISERFRKNPREFEQAFAKAWFKLTHRDMGPRARYLGPDAPGQDLIWQDPVPAVDHPLIGARDVAQLKAQILASGLTVPELVRAAWASAASYRGSDLRGGTNGARVRLAPQKDWPVNDPAELGRVLARLETIQAAFNRAPSSGTKRVSLADLIVLGGTAAVEKAAKDGGFEVAVPFTPGRTDATQEMTDAASFAVLEPKADGFRNYFDASVRRSPAEMLVDKASLLDLTIPETAVLVAGMRALDANAGGSKDGVLTTRPGTLTNDFFVNLLDMSTEWRPAAGKPGLYEGVERGSGKVVWTATPVDLVFGSNSELRAIAEFYAADDARGKFAEDFVRAWDKVMNLGRFDRF